MEYVCLLGDPATEEATIKLKRCAQIRLASEALQEADQVGEVLMGHCGSEAFGHEGAA